MLKILQSMSEFGGLWKHEKTHHALVGLGSAALVAAVVSPRQGGPNSVKAIIKVYNINNDRTQIIECLITFGIKD